MTLLPSRRSVLRGLGTMACSAAAHPLMTNVTFASAPWDERLVVIILRGAMDGVDVVRPVGDPAYALARPELGKALGLPLDSFFEAHPALEPLMPLWRAGDLGFAHAVSTPYRDKRSHFDGQDLLEAGTGMDVAGVRDGWLNRMLQHVPGLTGETAYAIGTDPMKVLMGPAEVTHWSPDAALDVSDQHERLLHALYEDDPLFHSAAEEAISMADLAEPERSDPRGEAIIQAMKHGKGRSDRAMAAFAAERLFNEARIVAFSLSGWDTHRNQGRAITRSIERLVEVIQTLHTGLGPVWEKTTILAMTEFGRTVRQNGTAGTDHGTGSAMIMAGGAVRGGRVYGTWPGLDEADLYKGRDLMPTGDVRAYAAWAMAGMFGLNRPLLEGTIFPGLDLGGDPGILKA